MQRGNDRFVERLPLVLHRPWLAYVGAVALCLVALGLRFLAEHVLPVGYPFVSFFPAVILTSFLFGVRPGIFAALLCGLLSWYIFVPPRMSFTFTPAVALAMAFYTLVVAIDILLIHFLQSANYNLGAERERSRALAENRELLFHELQHRVSNNLQVVAAMLALQRRHIDDDAARHALDEAARRTALVGKISRALYDPSGASQSLRPFLSTLCGDVVEASGRTDVDVRVDVGDDLRLHSHETVPVALIVAEMVSNAIEHGFADSGGAVTVTMRQEDGRLRLHIADDGKGLAPGVDPSAGTNLGLRIAHALARQLDGVFALEPRPEGGALARLDLPSR
jgi:two-component sensor histidine kinase